MGGSKVTAREKPAPATRLLSLALTVFPLLLLITSFILAAVSSAQSDWSYREHFDPDETSRSVGFEHRSPFVNCVLKDNFINVTAPDNTTVSRRVPTPDCTGTRDPGGLCDANADPSTRTISAFFCQHLSLSARLLYAGCALLGAALLVVLVLTAATLPQVLRTGAVGVVSSPWKPVGYWHAHPVKGGTYIVPPNHALSSYLAVLLTLLSALGALALLSGTATAAIALSVFQFPNGDFFSTGLGSGDPTSLHDAGPWMLGRSVGICAAGAVLGGVASYFVGFVWEGPRVGVIETHEAGVVEEK
ncbi:hypothetical protein QBC47DRAFT_417272 [Echria macrotheca]|uniref:Uncharacterized protein n=1 Tax=Echria macrotheca TaxID=438768 RepID=A0AAJ0B8H2_9PEZI|nr:hypothetical protein QBC47DRAFT_417272 [Echria macrotheca]